MSLQYNAIAIGIVGLMFFLLEFGSRLNFQTVGKGVIDINDLAKTFFVLMSVGMGWALIAFLVALGNGNIAGVATVTNNLIKFWVAVSGVLILLLGVYYITVIPKVASGGKQE